VKLDLASGEAIG